MCFVRNSCIGSSLLFQVHSSVEFLNKSFSLFELFQLILNCSKLNFCMFVVFYGDNDLSENTVLGQHRHPHCWYWLVANAEQRVKKNVLPQLKKYSTMVTVTWKPLSDKHHSKSIYTPDRSLFRIFIVKLLFEFLHVIVIWVYC